MGESKEQGYPKFEIKLSFLQHVTLLAIECLHISYKSVVFLFYILFSNNLLDTHYESKWWLDMPILIKS
jgi:hypothetical protein